MYIHGWGAGGTTPFELYQWTAGNAPTGNMTSGTISLGFTGLVPATRYVNGTP